MAVPHRDVLILPVETLNREFDAKLHLALRAVARGWKVVIGGRTAIHANLPRMPRSIYLAKGIRTGNRRILRLLEQLGHVIVALDEEALIRQSDEATLMMFDAETFNRPRLLYAWGRNNADLWQRFSGYRGTPILEVGNPRADMLREELRPYYAEDVEALRGRFGRFVLLSSNFGMVNHYIPNFVRFRIAKGSDAKRGQDLKSGMVAHKGVLFEAFKAMIPELARALGTTSLVIRPHPSENAESWSRAAHGMKNVHVVHEGPMAPWIIAADALVHNGCTSAVEAAIAGTPAFAYKPVVSAQFDVALPDGLSIECLSADELVSALLRSLSGNAKPAAKLDPQQRILLQNNVASVDGALSTQRILDSLETHAELLGPRKGLGGIDYLSGLFGHYRRQSTRAVTTRWPGSRSNSTYTAHKFPGFDETMLSSRIGRLRPLVSGLPPLALRPIAKNIYMIEKSGT